MAPFRWELHLDLLTTLGTREMGKREFIVLISLLMALTAMAIDMMLPAFGDIRSSFGLAPDATSVAMVVTVFFAGFGLGQLVWGPLSDALGRKRILWMGLLVYVVAAVGAALAPSLATLLALRFVGGLGAAGVRVVTQGVIRDRYKGQQMAKVLSYIMAVFLLVPMVAPSIGAAILTVADWRWIFGFYVIAAMLAALWATRLPETLPPERRIALSVTRLAMAGRAVATSRFTMGFTVAQMAVFGWFAAYLASSELIVDDVFGLGAWFPIIFGAGALVLGAAMLTNPRLLDRFGLRRMIRFTLVGYLVASALFALIAVAFGGHPPFWLYLVGVLPVLVAHSFVMPNLNAAAMMPMGRIAGTAAAIIGALSMLGGAIIGAIIAGAYDGGVTPFAMAGVLACVAAFVSYRWADARWEADSLREVAPDAQAMAAAAATGDLG